MSMTLEWEHRLQSWRKEIKNHFFRKIGSMELSGFTTFKQLKAEEALKCEFNPMPVGTEWGRKWEYGWFKGSVTLPPEASGKRIVLKADAGGESAIYVNGRNAGAKDREHNEITLANSGAPGETFNVLIECYAGHGVRVCSAGPTPPDRETVPDPKEPQTRVGESVYGIWDEEVYQLWLDIEALAQIRGKIDQNSLRFDEINEALKDFTLIVDFEAPYDEMIQTVKRCRERLRPLMECVNGSTAPTLYAFGHSHIDVAWLWPLQETERKCVRTFSTLLALMDEYPEYRFLQSQPHLYLMVKNKYPDLYARLKEKVLEGRIIAEGGMWVEADTNISGGESLIRQFIHGKRFFREEFGVENELLWLPDVFGYSGALPQIMKGCGIKYFSTQKIFWHYHGGERFPYNTFFWQGSDGSEVLSHIHNDYNSKTDPEVLIERWNERVQRNISSRLVPFGYGDGGGGPTRDHLEYLRRCKNLEGVPKTKICNPVDYFHDMEETGLPSERYVGELYFQAHRGTYTTQAKTKKGNRKSEFALREAEMWGAVAKVSGMFNYPLNEMDIEWKKVLLNQFHDIIPGSSIHRVYEEAEKLYDEVLLTAGRVASDAAASLISGGSGLTVFNSLSWQRKEIIEIPESFSGAADIDGNILPVQTVEGKKYAEVELPSCGWTTVKPSNAGSVSNHVSARGKVLENEFLRIEFNDLGEITSVFDRETSQELVSGVCNSFRMFKDVPSSYDAWDVDSMYEKTPVKLESKAKISVISSGPLFAAMKIERVINNSTLTQKVILKRGSRRVDFHTKIDWRERHKLLKVGFDVDIHANEAIHEIQFGHLKRPNHRSRQFDADRFEVCNHKWTALAEENRGVAVLNDCKYGVNVLDNSINLTLLRSAMAPDMTADIGVHEFTYSLYSWNGSFTAGNVIQEAYNLNAPALRLDGDAGCRSVFGVDNKNIVIETVKPAEDGSDSIVIRLYEAARAKTKCRLTTGLPVAAVYNSDMLENRQEKLSFTDNSVELVFKPFEIKTLILDMN